MAQSQALSSIEVDPSLQQDGVDVTTPSSQSQPLNPSSHEFVPSSLSQGPSPWSPGEDVLQILEGPELVSLSPSGTIRPYLPPTDSVPYSSPNQILWSPTDGILPWSPYTVQADGAGGATNTLGGASAPVAVMTPQRDEIILRALQAAVEACERRLEEVELKLNSLRNSTDEMHSWAQKVAEWSTSLDNIMIGIVEERLAGGKLGTEDVNNIESWMETVEPVLEPKSATF